MIIFITSGICIESLFVAVNSPVKFKEIYDLDVFCHTFTNIHVHSDLLWGHGSVVQYVRMVQKQDGGFNQCISIYTVISSPGNKHLLASKSA